MTDLDWSTLAKGSYNLKLYSNTKINWWEEKLPVSPPPAASPPRARRHVSAPRTAHRSGAGSKVGIDTAQI